MEKEKKINYKKKKKKKIKKKKKKGLLRLLIKQFLYKHLNRK